MIRMILGVSEIFDSAHFLPNHPKCGRIHGHTRLKSRWRELRNGMMIDFGDLKAMLKDIVAKFDHRLINELIENPTCENICLAIFNEIKDRLKDLKVVSL